MQEHNNNLVLVYELKKYTPLEQLTMFTGKNKRNFDVDFAQNDCVSTDYSGSNVRGTFLMSPAGNKTVAPTIQYVGICLSERYIIGTRKPSSTLIDIYERSKGSLAFQINGTDVPNRCKVIF